jgi:hypothetical protein
LAAYVIEHDSSRSGTVSTASPREEIVLKIGGTWDEDEVDALAAVTLPSIWKGLLLQDFSREPEGGGIWAVTGTYGKNQPADETPAAAGYTFNVGGETKHLSQALETVASYFEAGDDVPEDDDDVIGFDGESVAGVDVDTATFSWTETHTLAAGVVQSAEFQQLIYGLKRNPVSSQPFRGFAAGEVRFLGASGGGKGQEPVDVSFSFAAAPNETVDIGAITGIEVKGWEYLDIKYTTEVVADQLLPKPRYVYVRRVYGTSDLNQLLAYF